MLKEIDIMKQEIYILKSDAKQRDMEIRIDKLENGKNQLWCSSDWIVDPQIGHLWFFDSFKSFQNISHDSQ